MLNSIVGRKIEALLLNALQNNLPAYKQAVSKAMKEHPDASEQEINQYANDLRLNLASKMRSSLLAVFESASPNIFQRFNISCVFPTSESIEKPFHTLYRDAFFAFTNKEPKIKKCIEFAHKCNYHMASALQQLDDEST